MLLKIKVSIEPCLVSVVVLMRGCSGMSEYEAGKEKITVYSLQKTRLHHWRIRQRVPVPANIQQLRTAIEEEWTNIPQATINNLINSMRRRCVALREANGGHTRYWLVFGPPPDPPNTVKLHILEWPFIVASLRHTCAIIMLSNQHLDMLISDVYTNISCLTVLKVPLSLYYLQCLIGWWALLMQFLFPW